MNKLFTVLVRIFLLAIIILLGKSDAFSANYYFSSSEGNDSRTAKEARNSLSPWKSLSKLNNVFSILQPGDSVLFKRGDLFEGSIILTKSGGSLPIVFSAYGNGSKPEISGFKKLENWTASGTGIWETTVESAVNMLLVNGSVKALGRYPNANASNKGYLNFESFNGKTSITDNELSSNINWSGGEVVIRKTRWVLDRNSIISHSGNTINYASQSGYEPANGYGYFIQNHPSTLDMNGEWYYNASIQKLGIYTGSVNPSTLVIKAATIPTLVQIDNQNMIVFDNLLFTGAASTAFNISNSSAIRLSNCDIRFSGKDAINAVGATNFVVENTTITHTNNIAFKADKCNYAIIRNNTIRFTGMVPGMGEGDSGSYEGLLIGGDNNLVEYNVIDSTGYVPLSFGGNNVVIKNNFIKNYALVKDVGGAIYTWNNGPNAPVNFGRTVSGNIILNGKGAGEGTPEPDKLFAHGIYMDDNASNVEITSNTVADCATYGIYIHNAHDITIKQNTVYNNGVQLVLEHDNIAADKLIYNISSTDNIFFAKTVSQLVAEFKTKNDDIRNFGTFDNNYYSRPIDDNAVIKVLQQVNGVYSYNSMSLETWKSLYGKDQQSKKSVQEIPEFTVSKLIGSNKISNGSFNENINGLYVYSASATAKTAWSTGKLDGGALEISFSNVTDKANRAALIISIGAITKDKKYQLKFSLLGTNTYKTLSAFLRQSVGSYADLSERKSKTITAGRTEYELIFTCTAAENEASIVFDIEEQADPLYFDNITLHEVEGIASNPDNYIRFFYNPSTTDRSFPLTAPGMDQRKKIYTGTLTLGPFASSVLMNLDGKLEMPTGQCPGSGNINREVWAGIAGADVSDIPLQRVPFSSTQLNSFEIPANTADEYGSRIRGYVCPPITGNYTFFVAGDDAVELFLSSDDQPNNKVKIANVASWTNEREWYKFPSQRSAPVYLKAGNDYYIEALHKEENGGDHLSVAWKRPDDIFEGPIEGKHLIPYFASSTSSSLNEEKALENQNTFISVFPNPIREQATLEFFGSESGMAIVNLYDLQGKFIDQLFRGAAPPGIKKSLAINAQTIPNGMYLIRVNTGKAILTRTIIVQK